MERTTKRSRKEAPRETDNLRIDPPLRLSKHLTDCQILALGKQECIIETISALTKNPKKIVVDGNIYLFGTFLCPTGLTLELLFKKPKATNHSLWRESLVISNSKSLHEASYIQGLKEVFAFESTLCIKSWKKTTEVKSLSKDMWRYIINHHLPISSIFNLSHTCKWLNNLTNDYWKIICIRELPRFGPAINKLRKVRVDSYRRVLQAKLFLASGDQLDKDAKKIWREYLEQSVPGTLRPYVSDLLLKNDGDT